MDKNIRLKVWLEVKTPLYEYLSATPYFTLVDDPAIAEVIIFEHDHVNEIKEKPYFKKWPEKCVVVSETDMPNYFLPACYASNRRSILGRNRAKTTSYIVAQSLIPNPYVRFTDPEGTKTYLYSFRGGSTSWLRKRLFKLNITGADVLVQDANSYQHWNYDESYDRQKHVQQQEYADLLTKSSFFLCPRGAGISSIRLFEVMQAGRVPVIIADGWVPLEYIPWAEIAIMIPESDIANLDAIVRSYEKKAPEMGRKARKAWEEYCAPGNDILYLAHAIKEIQAKRNESKERIIRTIHPLFNFSKTFKDFSRGILKKVLLKAYSLMGKKFPYSLNRP